MEIPGKGHVTCHDDDRLTVKPWATEIRSPLIPRHRLFDRLSDGSRGPVTLISAPAGMGKSALVSSWVTRELAPGTVTWLNLDATDRRPDMFWPRMIEGFTRSGVVLPAICWGQRPGPAADRWLPQLCECLAGQAQPVVLVLDNLHSLGAGPVTDRLDFLITHGGPQLRLIAISRGTPPLPMHRYRLAGLVTEIDSDELAFTAAEAHALLTEHGVRPTENQVRLLVDRTEGWAAGLRLAAMSLRAAAGEDAEWIVRDFSGERADVAEYFTAEVLDGQPADTGEFLLATSVADVVTPGLATELSGRADSARLLRTLADADAFVSSTDGQHYRCHPLFRDLLRSRLGQDMAGRIALLHRRASAWLAANDQPVQAAYHAGAGGDWPAATALLVEHMAIGRLLIGPDVPRFRRVFDQLPAETTGVAAAIVRAALAMADNQHHVSVQHLSVARAEHADRSLPVRMAIAVLETLSAAARMDVDRTVESADVVAELAAATPNDLLAIVLAGKGGVLLWAGQLTEAEDSLIAAVRAAEAAGLDVLKIRTLGQIALLNAIHGRLRQASKWADQAAQLADRLGLVGSERPGIIDTAFAWIYTERCEPDAARRHVRPVSARDDPLTAAALTIIRGRHDHTFAGSAMMRQTHGVQPLWLTRSPNAEPRPATTRDTAPTLVTRVEQWLHTAIAELDNGRPEHASKALDRALKLAAPEGLRRPIAQASPRLHRLLQQNAQLVRRHPWLRSAKVRAAPGDDQQAPGVVQPLTKRELDVLRNMAELLSTQEIADAMFVSVNTVKTHIRGVLRKLSVGKRNEAIRRARDLGLL